MPGPEDYEDDEEVTVDIDSEGNVVEIDSYEDLSEQEDDEYDSQDDCDDVYEDEYDLD